MDFYINNEPPSAEVIAREREQLSQEIKHIKRIDTFISFVLIIISSIVVSFVVYSSMGSVKYAAISATIFPILATVLSLFGLTSIHGFRSSEMRLIGLNNSLIALSPVHKNNKDIEELCNKYANVNAYRKKVGTINRELINAELAMFWEWDSSTEAKSARIRESLEQSDSQDNLINQASTNPAS